MTAKNNDRRPTARGASGSTQSFQESELLARLKFSLKDGRLTLDNRRMLLLDAFSLGALRTELVDSLGIEAARGLLTRIGYASGIRDANSARRLYPDPEDYRRAYLASPLIAALEGLVRSDAVEVELDPSRRKFYAEFVWHNSTESETHVTNYGTGRTPVCWMQVGYACGFAAGFVGQPVVFREVQCTGMGHETCRAIGKPVDEWPDGEKDLANLSPRAFVNMNLALRAPPTRQRTQAAVPQQQVGASRADRWEMVGISAAFSSACRALERVAGTDATVLFTGESGVGKELFARNLHRLSARHEPAFVAVNCGAIPNELVESELFGVERGAFTGAVTSRSGRFELADGGTLFLDEVGTLTIAAQAKLLRVLQEGEFERVGGLQTHRVDVRIVAATNIDLDAAVAAGKFREDLFYRLNVFPINVPALRERPDDIPLLMETFFKRYCERYQRKLAGFTPAAVEALMTHHWPGNIRELENVVERAVILAQDGESIQIEHLFRQLHTGHAASRVVKPDSPHEFPTPDAASPSHPAAAENTTLDDIMNEAIDRTLRTTGGNVSAAARELGISRARLDYRLAKR